MQVMHMHVSQSQQWAATLNLTADTPFQTERSNQRLKIRLGKMPFISKL